MTSPADAGRGPLTSVDLWLPTDLERRTRLQVKLRNIALPVFLRKSVELHQCHRTPGTPTENAYGDLAELNAAYESLQADPDRKMFSEVVSDMYLADLAEAQAVGKNPAEAGFSVFSVALSVTLNTYLQSEASHLVPDSVQAAGIIAVHELCGLYEHIGPPKDA